MVKITLRDTCTFYLFSLDLNFPFATAANTSLCRELRAHEEENSHGTNQHESLVLLPLEVMVKPLELRFAYHFDSDKATNRLDKVLSPCNHYNQVSRC